MTISDNTTIVDLAYNLYGSLTGIPAILRQLPVGERIGFDTLPKEAGADVADIGQTWTPTLTGLTLDITVDKVYNTAAQSKAPYTTWLKPLIHNSPLTVETYSVIWYGEFWINKLYDEGIWQ